MPVITFEKISSPRGPVAPIAKKSRGLVIAIRDRFIEARARREAKRAAERAKKA